MRVARLNGKGIACSATVLLALIYAATPYVTLWRIAQAAQSGDARSLASVVDWKSVRDGIKSDIAEGLVGIPSDISEDAPRPQMASSTLPPFGASFASGIAGSVIDREVTPEHLVEMLRQMEPSDARSPSFGGVIRGVEYAFFDGPTSFTLRLRCPGQEADEKPLKLRLELRGGSWKIVRAWVPQDLMDHANSRT